MSSTNKTANYNLSQFIGTDKPAWLSDYNQDMSKIDAGIDAAKNTADGADSKATANTTSIGTLANLTTTDKTDLVSAINEVKSTSDSAYTTAGNANTTATAASLAITNLNDYLNLNSFTAYDSAANFTVTNGTYRSGGITVALNNTASICKIYGYLTLNSSVGIGNTVVAKISATAMRPSSDITINCVGLAYAYDAAGNAFSGGDIRPIDIVIKTNGDVEIKVEGTSATHSILRLAVFPCLYFVKSFGDSGSED